MLSKVAVTHWDFTRPVICGWGWHIGPTPCNRLVRMAPGVLNRPSMGATRSPISDGRTRCGPPRMTLGGTVSFRGMTNGAVAGIPFVYARL